MNPSLKTLEAMEQCFENTFNPDTDCSFTESQALAEVFQQFDLFSYEDLLQQSKTVVLLNWRLSQRYLLGVFMSCNLFRVLLENETIIKHLWTIRNEQNRNTILEIKAAVLDRILDDFSIELEVFMDNFDYSEFSETQKDAFLNCNPTETISATLNLYEMLRNLDSDLHSDIIELAVWERGDTNV